MGNQLIKALRKRSIRAIVSAVVETLESSLKTLYIELNVDEIFQSMYHVTNIDT